MQNVDANLWKTVFDKVDKLVRILSWSSRSIERELMRLTISSHADCIHSRADAIARLGVDMDPDANYILRKSRYGDARVYRQVVQYSTRCLAFAIDG